MCFVILPLTREIPTKCGICHLSGGASAPPFYVHSIEQSILPCRCSKQCARKRRACSVQAASFLCQRKSSRQHIGVDSDASHSVSETAIVVLSLSCAAQQPLHFCGFVGVVGLQPCVPQFFHDRGQPQQNVIGLLCAVFLCCVQDVSISSSFKPGINGATMAVTWTPLWHRLRMACNRFEGVVLVVPCIVPACCLGSLWI